MRRSTLLVGSSALDDAEEAMSTALAELGPTLHTLPDGETGSRRNWIIHIVESLRGHPDLELGKDGSWTDYDDTPVFKIRRGHTLYGASLDFGHVAAFDASYPLFRRLRAANDLPDLAFQVGIPGDFDMALFVLGPTGAFLHRRPFTEATLREIHAIHERAGDDVVFQIEVPAELVFVARMPDRLQPLMAGLLGRGITRLAQASPAGARFGVHLCLGDMNHRALGRMRDLSPIVHLANALIDAWPPQRRLEHVHAPFAAAETPAPTSPAFYAPLGQLRLPHHVRFVAGLVHEDRSIDEQRQLLGLVEQLLGRPVGVATACGLGRREREPALATLRQAAALCHD
ncbi:MAG: hypothetical protein M3425_09690 [Actinomycetota bacterium]|nr:hypothetical protein [Actinomycetota bacterium]